MTIIFSNCIINTDQYGLIYGTEDGLCFENLDGAHIIRDVPDDALQQIAVAKAEGKPYIEMEGKVVVE